MDAFCKYNNGATIVHLGRLPFAYKPIQEIPIENLEISLINKDGLSVLFGNNKGGINGRPHFDFDMVMALQGNTAILTGESDVSIDSINNKTIQFYGFTLKWKNMEILIDNKLGTIYGHSNDIKMENGTFNFTKTNGEFTITSDFFAYSFNTNPNTDTEKFRLVLNFL